MKLDSLPFFTTLTVNNAVFPADIRNEICIENKIYEKLDDMCSMYGVVSGTA